MTTLQARKAGSFAAAGTRGPNGRQAPYTPAYSTPADVTVSTTAALLSAIAAFGTTDGGKVIEVTADLAGAVTIPANANAGSWTNNILIRPPLGQRREFSFLEMDCPRVTFAGFDMVGGHHTSNQMWVQASRAMVWRVFDETNSQNQIRTPTATEIIEPGVIEFVTDWMFTGSNDRFKISGSGNVIRPLIEGCYLAPKVYGVFAGTSWTGGSGPAPVIDFSTASTLTNQTGVAVTTIPVSETGFDGTPESALLVYTDQAEAAVATVTLKINGVTWQTVPLDQHADNRFKIVRSVNRTWTAGEVITADVSGTVHGLHIMVGTDAQAGTGSGSPEGPEFHIDGVQHTMGSTYIGDSIYRDSVIATGNGSAFIIANTRGDCVWNNCFVGRALIGATAHQFGLAGGMRDHVVNCDFQSDQAADSTLDLVKTYKGNTAKAFTGTYTPDGTNVARGTNMQTPAIPNLAAAWPECPR